MSGDGPVELRRESARIDPAIRRGRLNLVYVAMIRLLSRIPAVLFFDLRVFGGNRVPRTGAAIIASNHQSFLDPWLLGLTVSRRAYFLARETLFRFKGFGRIIASLNALPISREGASTRRAIELGRAALQAGGLALLFPEGTRSRDGRLGPIKRGVDLIARPSGAPVVPAFVAGAFDVWPRDGGLTFRPVRIFFDRPLPVSPATVSPGTRRKERPVGDEMNGTVVADLAARLTASYRSLEGLARRVRWAGAAGPRGRLRYFS